MTVINLKSLSRWKRLGKDEAIMFAGPSDRERRVRLVLNLAETTTFHLQGEDGEERFLTVAPAGVSTVEFYVAGKVGLMAEPGKEVWFQSAEHEPTYVEVPDAVSFAKIRERRARNPELERVLFEVTRNAERRLAMQAAELTRSFEERLNRVRASETVGTGREEIQPEKPSAPEPASETGAADGGEQSGSDGAAAG